MSSGLLVGLLAGFVLWVIFVAVNVSVAVEIAAEKNRLTAAWALFAFLFPLAGPVLVWLLPPKRGRR